MEVCGGWIGCWCVFGASLLLWQAGVWLRYGVTESGRAISGLMDFVVCQGAAVGLGE